jgi:hypothetical protein
MTDGFIVMMLWLKLNLSLMAAEAKVAKNAISSFCAALTRSCFEEDEDDAVTIYDPEL